MFLLLISDGSVQNYPIDRKEKSINSFASGQLLNQQSVMSNQIITWNSLS